MFRREFFDHENPDGELPQDRVVKRHRRFIGGASENLYGQTRIYKGPDALAALMVEEWVNSPPHRENLLDPLATHLGVCVLRRQNTLRATQVFAKIVAYLTDPFPRTVKPGTTLIVSIEKTFPPRSTIAQYDIWDPNIQRRISTPTIFNDTLEVPDTTGTFRPRFYVLESGQYVIHQGPEFKIEARE